MSTIRVNRFENTSGVGFGACVQIANFTTNAVASGTTIIPQDDTIPQNTEGTEFLSLAFTPKSATNKLKITVNINANAVIASSYNIITALFQDSTASALAVQMVLSSASSATVNPTLIHYMTAGTTSATTFKVRVGANTAGTVYINGQSAARLFGGVYNSSITIEEFQV